MPGAPHFTGAFSDHAMGPGQLGVKVPCRAYRDDALVGASLLGRKLLGAAWRTFI